MDGAGAVDGADTDIAPDSAMAGAGTDMDTADAAYMRVAADMQAA